MGSGKQNRPKFTPEHNVGVSQLGALVRFAVSQANHAAIGAPSRHLRHALAVQIHFADAFYPREHVIHSLAA